MMDKLEPLIRHRFWILFLISLPLAMTGYFLANGEMQAATEKKEQELKGVLDGVKTGKSEPNQEFADGLQEINTELQEANNVEIQKLWEAQREHMDWPEIMLRYLPDTHRGEIDRTGRKQYVREYPGILNRLWRRVQPVVADPRPLGLTVDWPEKVLLMPDTIPTAPFHAYSEISSEEMWDAQEDIWMMEVIFDAIVRTNSSASYIGDAPVRRIDELYLTGGSGESSVVAASAAGGGGGAAGDYGAWGGDGARVEDVDEGGGGKGGRGRSRSRVADDGPAGGGMANSIGFDIAEEIGPPVPPAGMEGAGGAGGFGGDFTGGGFAGQRVEDDDGPSFGGRGGRGGSQAPAPIAMFRYIGKPSEVEKDPYHERAFYMSVIVTLPEVPHFLTEMASSEWPIRIGRFHIGPNPYGTDTTGSLTSSSRGSRRSASPSRIADSDDDDDGSTFGRGGLASRFSRALAGGSSLRGGGFSGGRSGSLVLPPTMVGPTEIDPNWFADPDLVQLDFYGVITMYKPITNDTITKKSDGTTEEESLKEIEQTEAAIKAAEAEAPVDESTEPLDPGTDEEPLPQDEVQPADDSNDSTEATDPSDPSAPEESPSGDSPANETNSGQ